MTPRDMTVRIGQITHERMGYWARDDEGQIRSRTRCRIFYTYEQSESNAKIPFGTVIRGQDVNCMTCLVAEARQ